MKKVKIFLLITCQLFFINCFAQHQSRNWFFSGGNAIVFPMSGTSLPTAIAIPAPGSQIPIANSNNNPVIEGSSSISDANGNLLFYTDGEKVWNRINVQMPSGFGLHGYPASGSGQHNSSTQQALIVPIPGSIYQYYIFTTPPVGGVDGLQYTVVDMSLNGGMVDVIAMQKNIQLANPVYEKIAAYKRPNGNYWLVAHENGNNKFVVYDINGTTTFPVTTYAVGALNSQYNFYGYLKFSCDGSKLAMAREGDNNVEVYNFNVATGAISSLGIISITDPNFLLNVYGIEFSPSGRYLYTTSIGTTAYNQGSGTTDSYLSQFDLQASNVLLSRVNIATDKKDSLFAALQLGPDNRIYVQRNKRSTLTYINNPDLSGLSCGYQFGIQLTRAASLGLPNFVANFNCTSCNCVVTCDCTPGFTFDPVDMNCKKALCNSATDPGLPYPFFWDGATIYQIGPKSNCHTH